MRDMVNEDDIDDEGEEGCEIPFGILGTSRDMPEGGV